MLTDHLLATAIYVVLGILVFVHELGHFLLAKKLGVGVLTFSLGIRTETDWEEVRRNPVSDLRRPLGGIS